MNASVCQGRFALRHVEPRRGAVGELGDRQVQAAALYVHVLSGILQSLFGGANVNVTLRHLAQKQYQDVVVVFDRRIQGCVGRLDGPAKTSPEVEFPGQVGSHLPLIEIVGQGCGGVIDAVIDPAIAARGLLGLRKQLAYGDVALGPGFHDAPAGDAQGQVLVIRAVDQRVKDRVVHRLPPRGIVRRRVANVGIARVDPVWGGRGAGGAVIGADFETVVQILLPTRTAGAENHQRSRHKAAFQGSDCGVKIATGQTADLRWSRCATPHVGVYHDLLKSPVQGDDGWCTRTYSVL